jgi:hypothetical protein
VKVLVIQVLSCFGVMLAVHHQVARWIHLFGVRFIYIDELLAGLMFPHLQVTCIAHMIGRSYQIHWIRRCIMKDRAKQSVSSWYQSPAFITMHIVVGVIRLIIDLLGSMVSGCGLHEFLEIDLLLQSWSWVVEGLLAVVRIFNLQVDADLKGGNRE